MNLDINDLRIVATLLSFAVFVAICGWALARRNRMQFDEAARLPFTGDDA